MLPQLSWRGGRWEKWRISGGVGEIKDLEDFIHSNPGRLESKEQLCADGRLGPVGLETLF